MFLFRGKKDLFCAYSDHFLYQIFVKGLVYNFPHLISLKQLEDLNIMLLFHLNLLLNIINKILHMGQKIWKIEHKKKNLFQIYIADILLIKRIVKFHNHYLNEE